MASHSYGGKKLTGPKVPDPFYSGRPGELTPLNRDLARPTSAAPDTTPPDRGTTGPRNPPAPHDPTSNSDSGANGRVGGRE